MSEHTSNASQDPLEKERGRLRAIYIRAWGKHRQRLPLEPLESVIVGVIAQHAEYHPLFEDQEIASRDFNPDAGESNPFLHMALHMAIREQLSTDRPAGIRDLYRRLLTAAGDAHPVEHQLMECLAGTLWEAQQKGQAADESAYLECVRNLAKGGAGARR